MRACALEIPEPFNPGICNQLFRDDLVISVHRSSSSKTHRHKSIPHLQITSSGIAAIS
jgi:hypothetical protein